MIVDMLRADEFHFILAALKSRDKAGRFQAVTIARATGRDERDVHDTAHWLVSTFRIIDVVGGGEYGRRHQGWTFSELGLEVAALAKKERAALDAKGKPEVAMAGFDIAQVCPNGHVATEASQKFPEFTRQFCETCGEKTLISCPSCNRPIRGQYQGEVAVEEYKPPAYCFACGKPFPWTESAIQSAIELSGGRRQVTGRRSRAVQERGQ